MIGPFDYHVFAHVDGRYRTAQSSAALTVEEKTALEQYFFGQTNDRQYLSSLSQEPGLIWRAIGDRFLLTRVLQGSLDASQRTTLQFETLLIPAGDAKSVVDLLPGIVCSKWEKTPKGLVIAQLREPTSRTMHPEVISAAALPAGEDKRFVRSATGVSLRDVQKIIQSCYTNPQFSLCHKSLSETAPVTVNFVADTAKIRRTPMTTATPAGKAALRPGRIAPAAERGAANAPVIILLALVLAMQLAVLFSLWYVTSGNGSIQETAQNVILTRLEVKSSDVLNEISDSAARITDQHKHANSEFLTKLDSVNSATNRAISQAKDDLGEKLDKVAKQRDSLADIKNAVAESADLLSNVRTSVDQQTNTLDRQVNATHDALAIAERFGRVRALLANADNVLVRSERLLENRDRDENERDLRARLSRLEETIRQLRDLFTDVSQALEGPRD